jgi:hypothetical protein
MCEVHDELRQRLIHRLPFATTSIQAAQATPQCGAVAEQAVFQTGSRYIGV